MASVSKRTWTHDGAAKSAWVVRYIDEKGVRRSKQFEKKKDADRYKQDTENKLREGILVPDTEKLTVSVVAREYLDLADARYRDGRIGQNRLVSLNTCFKKSIVPRLGKLKVADLTVRQVESFYQEMLTTDGLAVRTAKDRIYNLQLLEAHAIKLGYMKTRPVTAALKDLRGTRPSKVRTFMADEVAQLLATVDGRGFKGKVRTAVLMDCLVNLAAFTGLRYGEIMALDAESVDFDRRMIRVRRSLTMWGELKGPKTRAGLRDVPMPARVAERLQAWLRSYYVANEHGLIFRTPTGGAVSQANFHRSWTDLLDRAGLGEGERFHFHALRHFCASWMIENGLPVTEVAALLGHSKFDITLQTYAHPVIASHVRHDAMERMVAAMPAAPDALATHETKTLAITGAC